MIELTPRLQQTLVERAEQEAPLEACGLLSQPKRVGDGETPKTALWSAENVAAEPETSFLIDPAHQLGALQQMWARGEELVGIFHSHPRSSPEPSARDRELARPIEAARPVGAEPLIWVIVGFPAEYQDVPVEEREPAFWVGFP